MSIRVVPEESVVDSIFVVVTGLAWFGVILDAMDDDEDSLFEWRLRHGVSTKTDYTSLSLAMKYELVEATEASERQLTVNYWIDDEWRLDGCLVDSNTHGSGRSTDSTNTVGG